ncbi:gluconokinase [Kushneria pakistanensis]|uniref:Gluconokinase n=1 Tax=Kushneria pakistanensis TaxID=1508770 RepID=A0ABQ3F9M5_9GAMM|nr:gluconokinase [Kushneria pakistanensis]GHC15129.1 gluconokinase [Kushneria pakistanensis]
MVKQFDQRHRQSRRILIMGVSGSGKSTIGEAVAERTGCEYIDGDKYHPPENIDKMTRGISLTDEDRQGWLEALADLYAQHRREDKSVMIGCSGLKKSYRDVLRQGDPDLIILFLNGDYDTILQRMEERQHFFSPQMLRTQFDTLQPPGSDEAISIDISKSFDNVIDQCVNELEALD